MLKMAIHCILLSDNQSSQLHQEMQEMKWSRCCVCGDCQCHGMYIQFWCFSGILQPAYYVVTAPPADSAWPGRSSAPAGGPASEAPPAQLLPEGASSVPSLCSSDRAEAITDDGARRRDDPVDAEAERIKAVLLNNQETSEEALLELLRRLQQLEFTVDTLTVTEIGKAVSSLRKHNSRQIRQLVRLLIEGWKCIVDEWMSSRDAAIVEHRRWKDLQSSYVC